MSSFNRSLWRVASRIADVLQADRQQRPAVTLPHLSWQNTLQQFDRWDEVHRRGWFCAAENVRQLIELQLRWLVTDLSSAISTLNAEQPPEIRPTTRDLYYELHALHDEFDDVAIDLRRTRLTVTTDRIVLVDVDLGPFDIEWDWSRAGFNDICKVIAQEPNRPPSRDDVTHPHVLDDILCEGDAQQPLRQAIRTGRLCDYFLIVQQVLQTYNPSSAYVSLSEWDGVCCDHCDGSFSADEIGHCDGCETRVCDDCAETCSECSANGCRTCFYACSQCDQLFCPRCWPRRPEGPVFVCRACDYSAQTTNPNEETTDETTAPAAPPSATPAIAEPVAANAAI